MAATPPPAPDTPPPEQQRSDDDGSSSDSSDGEGDEGNWWDKKGDVVGAKRGEKRWDTLEHNGVLFPPPYVPHGIPIKYAGEIFHMTPEEEEIGTMFAIMRETDYYRHEEFRRNFMSAWRRVLRQRPEGQRIKSLELCDFDAIWKWWQEERAKKAALSKEDKKKLKAEKEKLEEPYKTCLWDGKKEEVANFRVEPPGLFRGRGKHPLMGCLKSRIQPEDITINIGEGAKVPEPPPGHRWKEVIHDNHVTWLAMWRDTVTDSFKYVMMAAASTIKGMSDREKFEKARRLKNCIATIRNSYRESFKSPQLLERQRAVALYFIDKLALRVGNEKGSDEADTVGCCSLRVEHLKPLPPRPKEGDESGALEYVLHFDFLGKDSIRYVNDVCVEHEVYDLIVAFTKGKAKGEKVFDVLDTVVLNQYLKDFMPDLSAKVFRTFNASKCLEDELSSNPVPPNATVPDKLVYFTRANTKVAILCNHQKTVSKGHETQVAHIGEKIEYFTGHIERLERAKVTLKKKGAAAAAEEYFADEDQLQFDWLEKYGKPEELEAYKAIVASRKGARPTTPKPRTRTPRPSAEAAPKSKPKQQQKREREEDKNDDDQPILPPPAKCARQEGKKETKMAEVKEEVEEAKHPRVGKKKPQEAAKEAEEEVPKWEYMDDEEKKEKEEDVPPQEKKKAAPKRKTKAELKTEEEEEAKPKRSAAKGRQAVKEEKKDEEEAQKEEEEVAAKPLKSPRKQQGKQSTHEEETKIPQKGGKKVERAPSEEEHPPPAPTPSAVKAKGKSTAGGETTAEAKTPRKVGKAPEPTEETKPPKKGGAKTPRRDEDEDDEEEEQQPPPAKARRVEKPAAKKSKKR